MADIKGLVDSGATDCFMSLAFVKRMKLGVQPLQKPRKIWNIDNTENKAGLITHYTDLDVETKHTHRTIRFLITNIGNEDIVLGYLWLAAFKPQFDWTNAVINEQALPVVLRSVNPHILGQDPIIKGIETSDTRIKATTATDLAVAAQQYTKRTIVPKEYQQFAKVFSEEESKQYPPRRVWDHAIELKEGSPDALDCKVYPLNQTEDQAVQDFIKMELDKGYIRVSKSPYASPFFFIRKKDGKLRPVQDYRKINALTVRNQYPLPLISDLLRDLSNAHIYTKLDVRWGYNNVRIREGNESKATFKTHYGLFEPTVMYFGLTNSPATFQTMMNFIYQDVILKHEPLGTSIRVYMDDIGIATRTNLADHIKAIHDVLHVAQEHNLFFKPEKCLFHAPSMDYLGVILEKGVTRMDPVKIAGIDKWPIPKNVTEVQRAVGFFNFYHPFIKGFAHIACPLHQLTRKTQEWCWGEEEQNAFDTLKAQVTADPVLAHTNLQDQFELEVDASGYAVGAILLQRKEDKKKHPIGYYLATLNEAQRNYDIYDLELLAIVMALRNWRPLLVGSPYKIIIYSDHLNLQYWRLPQKISRRVAREVLELSEYDFEIRHVPGKQNGQADALSRRPDYDKGENDNTNVVVLPEKVFARATTIGKAPPLHRIVSAEEMEREDPIYAQDETLIKPWVDVHRLKKIDGTWYKDGRWVVTGGLSHRWVFMHNHHDSPVYGHPGINKTYQLTSRRYWWPNMCQDVMEYIKGCADCQRHKINTRPTHTPLQPIYPKPEAMPFEMVALDFITKLPVSQGYDSILTITDHDCSKAAVFIPCKEAMTAEETVGLVMRHLFPRFGLPRRFISDRDPKFASRFIRGLCKSTGTEQNISTAYHPRTDGQSERTNQWIEQYLRFWVNERQDNWHHYLPLAEFAHNNWPNETTRESPFFVLYGFNPRTDWIDKPSPIPQVAMRLEQFKRARQRAQELMINAQKSWVKHKDTPKYKEGDLVWLEGRHLRTNQPMIKLAPKRHGPFPVIQVMSPINYQLKLPTQWSIHDVFHIDLLTPYNETTTHGPNYSRPPPDLIDKEEEYKVEKILDSRMFGRRHKLQYLVKWKGYPDSDNEWVNKNNVHVDEAIREFKNQNSASRAHKSVSLTGESLIPSSSRLPSTHIFFSPMTDVNVYYLGTPRRIFAAKLDSRLIDETEARELCAKKYVRPTIIDENALVAPLTPEELERIKLQFPDVAQAAMPARAQLPMVR